MFTKIEFEIMKLRKEGLTQVEAAKRLNIKQPSVSFFENKIKRKTMQINNGIRVIKNLKIKYDKENDEILY